MQSNSSAKRIVSGSYNYARPQFSGKSSGPKRDHCRFIPNRRAMDLEVSSSLLQDYNKISPVVENTSKEKSKYSSMLSTSLFQITAKHSSSSITDLSDNKILSFNPNIPTLNEGYLNYNSFSHIENNSCPNMRLQKYRSIPNNPDMILSAPNLVPDVSLNLLDWGSNNVLAVALSKSVFLYNASTEAAQRLYEDGSDGPIVTSVRWMPDASYLAVGSTHCDVNIWDVERMTCVRRMCTHRGHVISLSGNRSILSSGSRDGNIHNHDLRIANHHIATLVHHEKAVCGLQWSPNGTHLASGGNDNLVCVWNHQSSSSETMNGVQRWTQKYAFDHHTSAVKAVAWCPWQSNLLATGGGMGDRHLRFWNTTSGICVKSMDTESYVSSIEWSPNDKELLTSHGFSQNQLTVWKYPTMARVGDLKGHTQRVLYTATSPDGQTVVSAAADKTLRFWKVFSDGDRRKGCHGPLGENGYHFALSPRVIR